MPGQQSTETSQFFYELTQVKEDCYGLIKTIEEQHHTLWEWGRLSTVWYKHNVPLGKGNRECAISDVAVTYIKYIAHSGTQGLALHYVIIAEGFEGKLCRVFDNESWMLCSTYKVRQHQVFDSAS